MRATILAHLQAGGQGLDPVARAALERLTKANLEAAKQKTQLQ
jgi:hypothetical protein